MCKESLDKFENFYIDNAISEELKLHYIDYSKILKQKNVPVIFDFEHLKLSLGVSSKFLAGVVNSSSSFYRKFNIPKKRGGSRVITAPFSSLLKCQKWIYIHILKDIHIHPCAHGFTSDKSIITNAKVHLNQKEFLKVDLKDFFPSITITQVINIFKSIGYNHQVSFYLASICCYENHLPQGAPTSPVLSNIIAITLDNRISALARKINLNYTRYADDLAFSGDVINIRHLEYIKNIIQECGFSINEKKTLLQKEKTKRILTGISIANNEIKVPKDYKRKLKQEVHFIRKFGIEDYVAKNNISAKDYLKIILGKLNFWLAVEPKNHFAVQAYQDLIGKAKNTQNK